MKWPRLAAPAIAATLGVSAWTVAVGMSGCILAEAPSDLPVRPASHPQIDHSSAVPPQNQILRAFPSEFIVPVELDDPNLTFEIRAFIDFDRTNGSDIQFDELSTATPGSIDAGERFFSVALTPPDDLGACHTIEIVVATGWRGPVGTPSSHTPDQNGGDSINWFYAPDGDIGKCPVADPGDASSDGSSVQ